MNRQINGLIRLTRFKEYLFFVMVTTLLGAASANGVFGWKLVGVLAGNLLAVAFAFMINDVEDAPDDALDPSKRRRNPVSAQDISAGAGRLAALGVVLAALAVYALLGVGPLVNGAVCLVIAFLYSWRRIRLKTLPVLDLLSHAMMLAGLQFLTAYFTFEAAPFLRWVFPFTFLVAFSLYGELFNELRDLEVDLEAGLTHTACLLGRRVAFGLMMAMLGIGIGSALITVFVVRLIANWVLLLLVGLAALLVIPSLITIRRRKTNLAVQESFQKPFEIAAAFALAIQFVGPWLAQLFS